MKMQPTTSAFGTVLFLASALAASAVPVTYNVNMGVQIALGNFNPNSGDVVRVGGTFTTPDWTDLSFVLTPSLGDTNIYTGTFDGDQLAGQFENHKFIIDVGGGGTTLNWESIGNRFFQIPSTATNLGVVYFNDVTNANSLIATQITFQVDMGVQISKGNFNPASDAVYVAGDAINNWVTGVSVLTPSGGDTNVYVGTFMITNTVGATVNYKFIMNTFSGGMVWESDGVGPNGAQNRQFTFPNSATTLPVVYFNNISPSNTFIVEPITFQVNMAVQAAMGIFQPGVDSVSVAGDTVNNWSATTSYLTQSSSNQYLYVGTFDVTNIVGATVNYKFTRNGGAAWENNGVGPGGAQNRQFTFTNSATGLEQVFFNNISNLGTVAVTNVSGKELTLAWTGAPFVRLQSSTSLSSGIWQDVDDTLGNSTVTVTNNTAMRYFRLIGP
jgi:hypothetical protein